MNKTRYKNCTIILVLLCLSSMALLPMVFGENTPGTSTGPTQTPNADFYLYNTPSYQYALANSQVSSTIKLYSLNSFTGTVSLTATYPTGWSGSFTPPSTNLKANSASSSALSVTVPSSATAGKYTVTVTGTSGSTTHSATVTVQVISATLSPNPTTTNRPQAGATINQ